MQESNLQIKPKNGSVDLLAKAAILAVKGSGVASVVGPNGEAAFSFDGTGNAFIRFPTDQNSLFNFINTPFELEMLIRLNNTTTMQPLGNLINGTGRSDYAITLNNTYQVPSQLSLDGQAGASVLRYRFGQQAGNTTLPTNTWLAITLRRLPSNTVIEMLLNGTLVNQVSGVGKFDLFHGSLFHIGTSADGAYPVNGIIAKMVVTPL